MDQDAFPNCRFYVEVDGIARAVFTEVSGLQVETEVEEYREGGANSYVHSLPGRAKAGRLTLKRGIASTNEFLKWCLDVVQGKITRKSMSVVMYTVEGEELMRWNFVGVIPVKWSGPSLKADAATMAVESVELAHEGLTLA